MSATSRSPGLDAARTLAIGGVIMTHVALFGLRLGYTHEQLQPLYIWGGLYGVELFFVLSGLLIGTILFREVLPEPSWRTMGVFFARRWLRTLPAYYAVLAVLVVLAAWGWWPPHAQLDSVWRYIVFLQNTPPESARLFEVSWSLVVEQWAYIFIPLWLWAGGRCLSLRGMADQERRHLLLVIGALFGFGLLRLGVALYEPAHWDASFRKSTFLRLDTVLWGVLIAWFKSYRPAVYARLGHAGVFVLCGFGLWWMAGLYAHVQDPAGDFFIKSFGFSALSACLAFSLCFLDGNPVVRRVFDPASPVGRFVALGSRYAYSIYLVHMSVFAFCLHQMGLAPPVQVVLWFLLAVIVSAVLVGLLYHGVEKPCMGLRAGFVLKDRLSAGGRNDL